MTTTVEIQGSLLAMQVQAAEVARLIQETGDFEFAFQMQLQEALGVSAAAIASSAKSRLGKDKDDIMEEADDEAMEDRQMALTEQKQEVEKLNQEMEDEVEAFREQSRLTEIQAISEHDSQFARFLSSIPETEWDRRGENLEDPFTHTTEDVDMVSKVNEVIGSHKRRGKVAVMDSLGTTSVRVQSDMWEPALAAAFLVDADNPDNRSYLATIKECVHVEQGTSSSGKGEATCGICLEAMITPHNSIIVTPECMHRFCTACLQKHAETAVKTGKSFITCPQFCCEQLWPAEMSELLLSSSSRLILTQRQIEEAFSISERVYCPFQDCSMLQLKPELLPQPSSSSHPHQTSVGGVECFSCSRFFCLECQVPWHGDMTCEEFQSLPKDERTSEEVGFRGLVKLKKWQKCKKCGATVELKSGCHHITCRCGNSFCYTCGESWAHGHLCKRSPL